MLVAIRRHRKRRKLPALGAMLAGLLATLPAAALLAGGPAMAQTQSPAVVIVFDGSGSMWGKIEGSTKSKLALMREAIVDQLRSKAPNVRAGLTTFGAQANGSCSSSRVPLKPTGNQLDALQESLRRFNPQGRGPVVLGLQRGLESLEGLTGRAHLVLVHDSPDNCSRDVCAFARDAAASHPNVRINVLSLAPKPTDVGAMRCLTKATGGTLIEAASAAEAIAGVSRIVAGLRLPDRRDPSPAQPRTDVARPQVPASENPIPRRALVNKAGLTLSARLEPNQRTITRGISWQIDRIDSSNKPFSRRFNRANVNAVMAPGRYRVTLQTANRRDIKTISVAAGKRTAVAFTLAGGLITIAADDALRGDTIASVIQVTTGPKKTIWSGPVRRSTSLLVQPGRYRVSLGNGLARKIKIIDVADGSINEPKFSGRFARLIVEASGLSPAQRAAAKISVAVEDPKSRGGRRTVAETVAPTAEFALPPGPYHVTLSAFGEKKSQLVVLAANQTSRQPLNLSQMALSVTSLVGNANAESDLPVRYRLWRAGQFQRPLAVRRKINTVFHIAPGKYRIESRIGLQNAVILREFDVGAAATGRLVLRHNAGRVTFSTPVGLPPLGPNAYWEIADGNGRPVWRTFDDSPVLMLSAGTYKASVTYKQQRYSAKFAVVPGQSQPVALGKL